MIIKNTGYDVNAAGSYSVRRLDTADSAHRKTDSSSFTEQLCKASQTKMDRIELSQQPVENPSALSDAKKKVIKDLKKDADPERLNSLKEQVQTGKYTISASELAQILISIQDAV